MEHSATYSPEDNKLRLYPAHRLDADEYAKVKAHGFSWAPKQELFVAPMWTPSREDFLIAMCGEIGDEDTSLIDRAEAKSERLENLSERKTQEAQRAHDQVSRITDGIPLGQPILIGHHSEKHARKDAEKIQNGMRKAVDCWKSAGYWTERAAGAIRHAKYKELPGVRYRRIKGLESDKRKQAKYIEDAEQALRVWTKVNEETDTEKQMRMALAACNLPCRFSLSRKEGDRPDFDQKPDAYAALTNSYPNLYAPRTIEEVLAVALAPHVFPASVAHHRRWLEHYENRIAYERAMLDEQGGLKGEQFNYQIGGRILRRGEWLPILKINKRGGIVQSVTVAGHFASTVSVDEIRDYREPEAGESEKVKAAIDKGPMCNYPGEGFRHMTTAEWKGRRMSDVAQAINHKATDAHAKHRTRATAAPGWSTVAVYLTDSKRIDAPAPPLIPVEPVKFERIREAQEPYKRPEPAPAASLFEAMEQTLKAGVKVVSAPQLFPTPPELAARMIEEANIEPTHRVLEPSAGTGNLLKALPSSRGGVVAVEVSSSLLYLLECHADEIVCGDFLEQNGNLGKFDRVVMNPPFINGADVKHIKHALTFLNPGGRLVAICANGPRQREALKPLAENSGGWWEDLPEGTFKDQGTNVNTALLVIEAP